jgi:D-alanine-D-alanine ligase
MTKTRVGILFGGESGEHEVSLASATSVLNALDRGQYEPVLIGITRDGRWVALRSTAGLLEYEAPYALADGACQGHADAGTAGAELLPMSANIEELRESAVDVVFPVMHGPRGEDGTVQGLLELAGLPYVGSGVLASSVSMDKAMMKAVFADEGLPSVPHELVTSREWEREPERCLCSIESHLTYPVFVKPCNMGSSVGISKALDRDALSQALALAARFDRRIIVEQGVDAREVECGVLGNEEPEVSVPGEIVPHHEFYDFSAKYTAGLADLVIPAELTAQQTHTVQALARRAFIAVDAAGLARVDFFVLRETGDVVVNEINTIPGFTATSMYPRLWEASGVSYTELLDRLLRLASERHEQSAEQRKAL